MEQVERPVPMRPENPKLPLIDFEVAESDYGFASNWKFSSSNKAKAEKKAHHPETHKENKNNLSKEGNKEKNKAESNKEVNKEKGNQELHKEKKNK